MPHQVYKNQVALLLTVLPEVAKQEQFALHGGTAINLFVRDMPRISVDIDLTYVPIDDDRETALTNINNGLGQIRESVRKIIPDAWITGHKDSGKLSISTDNADIKLEVNLVRRGCLAQPAEMLLCTKAQTEFDVFCTMPVVPRGQLYGGKICAALDRQHPRDIFDVRDLLDNEGFDAEIKTGLLLYLASSNRPMEEILCPNFTDQRHIMHNQFEGMSDAPFTYDDFEATRKSLLETVHAHLTEDDKDFLIGLKNLTPDWTIHDFSAFPGVKWKLYNLQALYDRDPDKHQRQYDALVKCLSTRI